MHVDKHAKHQATVTLDHDELLLLNNALNEVSNALDFEDDEFATRLGVSRERARKLLAQVGGLLAKMK